MSTFYVEFIDGTDDASTITAPIVAADIDTAIAIAVREYGHLSQMNGCGVITLRATGTAGAASRTVSAPVTYSDYLAYVDVWLAFHAGIGRSDIADYNYLRDYRAGRHASVAATHAIRANY